MIDGNHDAPGEGSRDDGGYRGWTAPTNNDLHLDPEMLVEPELWHLERGARIKLADRDICFVGSAISVDRARRTTGRSWWPSEAITDRETEWIVAGGRADLLISHDSAWDPPGTRPVRFAPELQADLAAQRLRMQHIGSALQPALHVHGHWHRRYMARINDGPVIGLDYESTLGLHVIDLDRLDHTAQLLNPLIAAMWWFDTLDNDAQTAVHDELENSPDQQAVICRHEHRILADQP